MVVVLYWVCTRGHWVWARLGVLIVEWVGRLLENFAFSHAAVYHTGKLHCHGGQKSHGSQQGWVTGEGKVEGNYEQAMTRRAMESRETGTGRR